MLKSIALVLIAIFVSIAVASPPSFSIAEAEIGTLAAVTQNLSGIKLVASSPVAAAEFGQSVAIDGTTAVVGAPKDNGAVATSGAAYIFRYNGTNWVEAAKLTASDGEAGDAFGRSVAISGNTVVVGANGDDDAGGNAGAAYIFEYDGTDWTEVDKLTPDTTGDTFFGWSVAISGTTIVVGAPYRGSGTTNSGSAYIFEKAGGDWNKAQRLSTNVSGGAVLSDLFGWSVAIDGTTIVVGAYLDDVAYVFGKSGAGWAEEDTISGSDTLANDRFGWSVAIDGSTIAVGAVQDNDAGNNAGATYIFRQNGTNWTQATKLTPGASQTGSRFGWSVAIDANTLVVGARESKGRADKEESGAAYVFTFNGTHWTSASPLYASDAAARDHFGAAVAISGATALVGAPADYTGSTKPGAAYVYKLSSSPAPDPDPSPEPDPSPDPDPADCAAMAVQDESSEEIVPGTTATWTSAFRCENAPDEGSYGFTVTVSSAANSETAITIDDLLLTHTTPRPLGQAPEATADVKGLPITVAPGESQSFTVSGTYKLVGTDAGKKANLHFCASGKGQASGEPFCFGLNALIRGPGASESEDDTRPPVISNITIIPGPDGATITWTTDLPATSRVVYTVGDDPTARRAVTNGCKVTTQHSIELTDLLPDTRYVYQIQSRNGAGVAIATPSDATRISLPIILN